MTTISWEGGGGGDFLRETEETHRYLLEGVDRLHDVDDDGGILGLLDLLEQLDLLVFGRGQESLFDVLGKSKKIVRRENRKKKKNERKKKRMKEKGSRQQIDPHSMTRTLRVPLTGLRKCLFLFFHTQYLLQPLLVLHHTLQTMGCFVNVLPRREKPWRPG